MEFLGVDIGSSSIKYGRVSLGGEVTVSQFDVIVIPPQTLREEKYADAIYYLLQASMPYQAVCLGFPNRVWENKILSTTIEFNDLWTGVQEKLKSQGVPCFAMNDADAAGMAEVHRKGAEELRHGVTALLTLGSGIGSAIFHDGKLLPNTEMGNIEMHGIKAEQYAAPSIKTQKSLSIQEWAARLQEYLDLIEHILSPNHLVLGGGISVDFSLYEGLLKTRASLQPAFYRNQAGVIGTAIYAAFKTHSYDQKGMSGFESP
jgi:polyphosphate glucokinase